MKRWLAGLSALTLSLGMAAPAISAEANDTPTSAPTSAASSISDQELKTFALAALEVREIGASWQPRIAEAESPEKAESVRQEARDEMVEAVKAKGLTVERYNLITQQVKANPELAQAVTQHMREAQ